MLVPVPGSRAGVVAIGKLFVWSLQRLAGGGGDVAAASKSISPGRLSLVPDNGSVRTGTIVA